MLITALLNDQQPTLPKQPQPKKSPQERFEELQGNQDNLSAHELLEFGKFYRLGIEGCLRVQVYQAYLVYQKAAALNGEIAEVWYELGMCCTTFQNTDQKKIAAFKKAIELNTNYKEAWFELANAYSQENTYDYNQAEKCYDKALELDKNFAMAWFHLAMLYKSKRPDLAFDCYKKTTETAPNFKEGWLALANCYRNGLGVLGDEKAEKRCLNKIDEINKASGSYSPPKKPSEPLRANVRTPVPPVASVPPNPSIRSLPLWGPATGSISEYTEMQVAQVSTTKTTTHTATTASVLRTETGHIGSFVARASTTEPPIKTHTSVDGPVSVTTSKQSVSHPVSILAAAPELLKASDSRSTVASASIEISDSESVERRASPILHSASRKRATETTEKERVQNLLEIIEGYKKQVKNLEAQLVEAENALAVEKQMSSVHSLKSKS